MRKKLSTDLSTKNFGVAKCHSARGGKMLLRTILIFFEQKNARAYTRTHARKGIHSCEWIESKGRGEFMPFYRTSGRNISLKWPVIPCFATIEQ